MPHIHIPLISARTVLPSGQRLPLCPPAHWHRPLVLLALASSLVSSSNQASRMQSLHHTQAYASGDSLWGSTGGSHECRYPLQSHRLAKHSLTHTLSLPPTLSLSRALSHILARALSLSQFFFLSLSRARTLSLSVCLSRALSH